MSNSLDRMTSTVSDFICRYSKYKALIIQFCRIDKGSLRQIIGVGVTGADCEASGLNGVLNVNAPPTSPGFGFKVSNLSSISRMIGFPMSRHRFCHRSRNNLFCVKSYNSWCVDNNYDENGNTQAFFTSFQWLLDISCGLQLLIKRMLPILYTFVYDIFVCGIKKSSIYWWRLRPP